MTIGRFEQRVWDAHANHIRYRDEYAKALRVLKLYPLYELRGAARHHLLNGDIFEEKKITYRFDEQTEQAMRAKRLQEAETAMEFRTVAE
jgi:hypothetical protein